MWRVLCKIIENTADLTMETLDLMTLISEPSLQVLATFHKSF